jgi:hypothetical protein
MEQAAEALLEKVLRRRRWAVADKEAVARFLLQIVRAETRRKPSGDKK